MKYKLPSIICIVLCLLTACVKAPEPTEVRTLTVLFGGRSDSPEFEALGDVVQLDEVTE